MDVGLLLLRLAVGLTLAAHGTQKLFGWFGGPGLDAISEFFETPGFHPGRRHALIAGLVETVGGFFLALGFLTPAAATATFAAMLVAGVSVHFKHGFFITGGLRVHAGDGCHRIGGGRIHRPRLVVTRRSAGIFCEQCILGMTAFGVGLVGGVIQLTQRQAQEGEPQKNHV
jgi:putative oxidoreductase